MKLKKNLVAAMLCFAMLHPSSAFASKGLSLLCSLVVKKVSGIGGFFYLKKKTVTESQAPKDPVANETRTDIKAFTLEMPNFQKMNDLDLLGYLSDLAHLKRTEPAQKIKQVITILNGLPGDLSVDKKAELWEYFAEALYQRQLIYTGSPFLSSLHPSPEGTRVYVGQTAVRPKDNGLILAVPTLFIDKSGRVFQSFVNPRRIESGESLDPEAFRKQE